jgi:uncharacterized protein YjgD (DUF1641 family)
MNHKERSIYLKCKEIGISDVQAKPLSKASSYILSKTESLNALGFSHIEIASILKNAIAKQANEHNIQNEFLIELLSLVDKQLEPIIKEIENAKE